MVSLSEMACLLSGCFLSALLHILLNHHLFIHLISKTMKSKLFFLLVVLSVFLTLKSFSQFVLKDGYLSLLAKDKAEQSFKYKNLILYPILGGSHFVHESYTSNYTSLEDALKQKKVVITEKESGQVNQLFIENVSTDTVYIMAGEVVKGGKQDRVISDDKVLVPKSGKLNIDVFCVEHNRWTYKSDRNFSQYHSLSTNSVRKSAVKEKNQVEVWDKVAEVTTKQNAQTSTGTYTALTSSASFTNDLNAYLTYFTSSFKGLNNCVGFVGISENKIIGCDIFASNEMFKKQLKNLLQSYSTEAITSGKPAVTDYTKVTTYLKGYLADEKQQDANIEKVGKKYEFRGKKMHINTY
jgi:hypothetical protein